MKKILQAEIHLILSLILMILCSSCMVNHSPEISIVIDENTGLPVQKGIDALINVLEERKISFEYSNNIDVANGETVLVAGLSTGGGAVSQLIASSGYPVPEVPEALAIRKTVINGKKVLVISGYDDLGLTYGLIGLSERICWSKKSRNFLSEVEDIIEQPYVSERALSVYALNRKYWETRFYDKDYWKRYLDLLLRNRFNTVVVILGYNYDGFLTPPFPYFFNLKDFPSVRMVGLDSSKQKRNREALNDIIRLSHDRGLKITIGIWDYIYRGSERGKSVSGREPVTLKKQVPGLVWGVTSDNVAAYNTAAIAEFIKTFPDIDGIQFRMHWESGLRREEMTGFWSNVFKQMKVTAPKLRIDLRAKELPDTIINIASDLGLNFRIDTKFWMEQLGMPWHPTQVNPDKEYRRHSYGDMLRYPQKYKIHWRLWNGGTARLLLWGDPGYVDRFVLSTHLYDGEGFEVNEPLAGKMLGQPAGSEPFEILNPDYRYYDYEFERYWHFFQVFGRIAYNPDTSPDVWRKEFEKRFGKRAGLLIEEALHKASWVLPRIVATCYPYSYFPMSRGWAEKQRLGNLQTYSRTTGNDLRQFAGFDEEAEILLNGGETAKILPSMTSLWLEETSGQINDLVLKAENAIGSKRNNEFISTITDLKILSGLALYHSRRIPAAVSYRLFDRTRDVSALDDAIYYEEKAIDAWRKIVRSASDIYSYDLKMGNPDNDLCGHWRDELAALEKDLETLKKSRLEYVESGNITSSPKYKIAQIPDNNRLFKIQHKPVQDAPVGKPIKISVNVTCSSGVKWVHLLYRSLNQEMEYSMLPMISSEGSENIYEAIIPADQIDPGWDFMYLIEIMGNDGKGTIFPDFNTETPYVIIKLLR